MKISVKIHKIDSQDTHLSSQEKNKSSSVQPMISIEELMADEEVVEQINYISSTEIMMNDVGTKVNLTECAISSPDFNFELTQNYSIASYKESTTFSSNQENLQLSMETTRIENEQPIITSTVDEIIKNMEFMQDAPANNPGALEEENEFLKTDQNDLSLVEEIPGSLAQEFIDTDSESFFMSGECLKIYIRKC